MSWFKKIVDFFTPQMEGEAEVAKAKKLLKEAEVLDAAVKEATIELEPITKAAGKVETIVPVKPKRARTKKGRYKADDKSTPDFNEAWEGGKAPKKNTKKKK